MQGFTGSTGTWALLLTEHVGACCTGVPVEVHEATAAKMRRHYDARGLELNAARLRMATLPATAEVMLRN